MKPGVGWIIAGVLLLGAGVLTSLFSHQVVWYGAIIVGLIWIVRGALRLSKSEPPPT